MASSVAYTISTPAISTTDFVPRYESLYPSSRPKEVDKGCRRWGATAISARIHASHRRRAHQQRQSQQLLAMTIPNAFRQQQTLPFLPLFNEETVKRPMSTAAPTFPARMY